MDVSGERAPLASHRLLNFATWIQIPLILLSFGVSAYLLLNVRPLLQKRDALNMEIQQKKELLKSQEESLKIRQQEIDASKAALGQLNAAIAASGAQQLYRQAQRVTPISSQVKISAKAEKTKQVTSDGKPMFNFTLWTDGPADVLARMTSVSYDFNHPTFKNPHLVGYDREGRLPFAVSYLGWGCLRSVIVTFTLVTPQGEPPKIDFDMCSALTDDASLRHPE